MSEAYFIELNTEEPAFDASVNGIELAKAAEDLGAICDANGWRTLENFVGPENPDALNHLVDHFDEDDDDDDHDETYAEELVEDDGWHDPEDGLVLVRDLIEAITADPTSVNSPEEVLTELREFEAVLKQAGDFDLRWYLGIE